MESFGKVTLGLLFVICVAQITDGCSCARSHPQEHLCKEGSFAALVKVRNAEFVYIIERPRPRSNGTRNSTSALTPENIVGLDKRVDTGRENVEMERVEVVVSEKDLHKMFNTNFVVSYIRYRVKVYETYKGLNREELAGKKVYIYTASYESLCGASLKQKGTYLLIGSVGDDKKLRIGLCNYHLHWNSLESKQRRVIKRNMRAATKTCDSECAVYFCDTRWSSCEANKDTCLWTSQMERTNHKLNVASVTYACKRDLGKQESRCTWTDGLAESKRGRRRRRRNHTSGLKFRARTVRKSR